MRNTWRKLLLGDSKDIKVGAIVKLITNIDENKEEKGAAEKGTLALCVNGEKEFPELYANLVSRIGKDNCNEFIWVKWLSGNCNRIDGAYAKFRFEEISIQNSKFN